MIIEKKLKITIEQKFKITNNRKRKFKTIDNKKKFKIIIIINNCYNYY